MNDHICKRCGFSTPEQSLLLVHLKQKKQCPAAISKITCKQQLAEIAIVEPTEPLTEIEQLKLKVTQLEKTMEQLRSLCARKAHSFIYIWSQDDRKNVTVSTWDETLVALKKTITPLESNDIQLYVYPTPYNSVINRLFSKKFNNYIFFNREQLQEYREYLTHVCQLSASDLQTLCDENDVVFDEKEITVTIPRDYKF